MAHKHRHPEPTESKSAIATLNRLRVPGEGIHTSEGQHFNNTLFGRDSAITSRELLDRDPSIAHDAILMLASHQGVTFHPRSDEEPGRIHHEDRDFSEWEAGFGKKLPYVIASLAWGGNTREFTTYFSMDATPLYTLLVADYVDRDPSILDESVVQKDGNEVRILESLIAAGDWMTKHIADDGIVEIARHNKYGLTHQTWKDSLTGYIHENGQSLNLSQPIAYLEVQALTVEGLRRGADTIEEKRPEQARIWREYADIVAKATIEKFWNENDQYFVSSLDRDEAGYRRQDRVEQSDPGWMLNTSIFDGLKESEKEKYIGSIVRRLFSIDFLTGAGIRSRSIQFANSLDVADYHGSLVTWPIDTYMIAKGLRRQQFPALAEELEARVLNTLNRSDSFYEFYYVESDGTILFDPEHARKFNLHARDLPVQMFPEKGIAWTVAAALMIKYRNARRLEEKKRDTKRAAWRSELEEGVLTDIQQTPVIRTVRELKSRFPTKHDVYLNFAEGVEQTRRSLWEAYRPRLPQKRKLGGHAIKTHRV